MLGISDIPDARDKCDGPKKFLKTSIRGAKANMNRDGWDEITVDYINYAMEQGE